MDNTVFLGMGTLEEWLTVLGYASLIAFVFWRVMLTKPK